MFEVADALKRLLAEKPELPLRSNRTFGACDGLYKRRMASTAHFREPDDLDNFRCFHFSSCQNNRFNIEVVFDFF